MQAGLKRFHADPGLLREAGKALSLPTPGTTVDPFAFVRDPAYLQATSQAATQLKGL
jgi:hypothetical protein